MIFSQKVEESCTFQKIYSVGKVKLQTSLKRTTFVYVLSSDWSISGLIPLTTYYMQDKSWFIWFIDQSELRTYTKVVLFKEKSSFRFVVF
jgi:hypothetical protein